MLHVIILDILIYWSYFSVSEFILFYAFGLGLIFDLLTGGYLGLNALGFAIVSYISNNANSIGYTIEDSFLYQIFTLVKGLIVYYFFLFLCLLLFTKHFYINSLFSYFLNLLLGVLLWPVVKYVLDKYRTIFHNI